MKWPLIIFLLRMSTYAHIAICHDNVFTSGLEKGFKKIHMSVSDKSSGRTTVDRTQWKPSGVNHLISGQNNIPLASGDKAVGMHQLEISVEKGEMLRGFNSQRRSAVSEGIRSLGSAVLALGNHINMEEVTRLEFVRRKRETSLNRDQKKKVKGEANLDDAMRSVADSLDLAERKFKMSLDLTRKAEEMASKLQRETKGDNKIQTRQEKGGKQRREKVDRERDPGERERPEDKLVDKERVDRERTELGRKEKKETAHLTKSLWFIGPGALGGIFLAASALIIYTKYRSKRRITVPRVIPPAVDNLDVSLERWQESKGLRRDYTDGYEKATRFESHRPNQRSAKETDSHKNPATDEGGYEKPVPCEPQRLNEESRTKYYNIDEALPPLLDRGNLSGVTTETCPIREKESAASCGENSDSTIGSPEMCASLHYYTYSETVRDQIAIDPNDDIPISPLYQNVNNSRQSAEEEGSTCSRESPLVQRADCEKEFGSRSQRESRGRKQSTVTMSVRGRGNPRQATRISKGAGPKVDGKAGNFKPSLQEMDPHHYDIPRDDGLKQDGGGNDIANDDDRHGLYYVPDECHLLGSLEDNAKVGPGRVGQQNEVESSSHKEKRETSKSNRLEAATSVFKGRSANRGRGRTRKSGRHKLQSGSTGHGRSPPENKCNHYDSPYEETRRQGQDRSANDPIGDSAGLYEVPDESPLTGIQSGNDMERKDRPGLQRDSVTDIYYSSVNSLNREPRYPDPKKSLNASSRQKGSPLRTHLAPDAMTKTTTTMTEFMTGTIHNQKQIPDNGHKDSNDDDDDDYVDLQDVSSDDSLPA